LIFAKDDSHADDIVQIVREEFGKGNEFAQKITYKVAGVKPEDLIASFRNSYYPRIAVTVDMISTGTDIKPLEVLLFMRSVKSQGFFEQMKGRGTRTIGDDDLRAVTPDAGTKTHFVLVDAVGVCERMKTDEPPLERKRSVPFDKLLYSVALGNHDEDTLSSLAGRLGRLATRLTPAQMATTTRWPGWAWAACCAALVAIKRRWPSASGRLRSTRRAQRPGRTKASHSTASGALMRRCLRWVND
jgi:type I restriction enzyme R subunit